MNLPNKLTVSRLYISMAFVLSMSVSFPFCKTVALILFIAAGITDYLDGEIARRNNLITDFGKLMDPLVDKIMTASAFICLVPLGLVPAWAAIIIIAREFLITGLRLLASSKGTILPAEKLGKHKTIWQISTILFFLVLLAVRELFPVVDGISYFKMAGDILGPAALTITVALTLYSGIGYFWRNRDLISTK